MNLGYKKSDFCGEGSCACQSCLFKSKCTDGCKKCNGEKQMCEYEKKKRWGKQQ